MGLHPNSEIMTNQNESNTLLRLAKSIQPNNGGSQAQENDSQTLDLIGDIEGRIPTSLDMDAIKERFPVTYEDSFNTVLIQEATKFNQLLESMRQSIANLKLAVAGLIVLNSDLENILKSILNYSVPSIWSQTFLSLKPLLSWMEELQARVKFFSDWTIQGKPNCFWFNAFSFPQAFLTGTLQNYARKTRTAIDQLGFEFQIMETAENTEALPSVEAGVYIHGLFLEGVRWDYANKELQEPLPNELYSKLPVVWLKPALKTTKSDKGVYKCPMYKTLTRSGTLTTTGHSSNFVMMINLPSGIDSDHWTRRGAACFLALKD
jgi:dynein heavy chain